jgi:hypothetical protein
VRDGTRRMEQSADAEEYQAVLVHGVSYWCTAVLVYTVYAAYNNMQPWYTVYRVERRQTPPPGAEEAGAATRPMHARQQACECTLDVCPRVRVHPACACSLPGQ